MYSLDWYAVTSSQVALGIVFVFCLALRGWRGLRAILALRSGSWADLTVQRGERSMNGLFTLYGVATVALSLSVEVSSAFEGTRSALVVGDYLALSYLFFFDVWFRNSIVFNLLGKISKD